MLLALQPTWNPYSPPKQPPPSEFSTLVIGKGENKLIFIKSRLLHLSIGSNTMSGFFYPQKQSNKVSI